MEFLKQLLIALINGFIIRWAMRFYDNKIANPESSWYYGRLIQRLKLRYYTIRIMIILALYDTLKSMGYTKISREIETKILLLTGVLIAAAVIIMIVNAAEEDKKAKTVIA